MRFGAFPAILAVMMSACGPWPQVDAPLRSDDEAWPTLLPIDQVTALADTGTSAQTQAQQLSARAAALRARAQIMRQAVPDQDAFDALRARLAR